MNNSNTFSFEIRTYREGKLSPEDNELIRQAKNACQTAYAPYSQFEVGAAVLMENGQTIIGSNQENAAYPSGLCAERVALFTAATNHKNSKIKKIAVTARKANHETYVDAAPCGSCRQVMLEYEMLQNENIEVLFHAAQGWVKLPKAAILLPYCFDKKSLK